MQVLVYVNMYGNMEVNMDGNIGVKKGCKHMWNLYVNIGTNKLNWGVEWDGMEWSGVGLGMVWYDTDIVFVFV